MLWSINNQVWISNNFKGVGSQKNLNCFSELSSKMEKKTLEISIETFCRTDSISCWELWANSLLWFIGLGSEVPEHLSVVGDAKLLVNSLWTELKQNYKGHWNLLDVLYSKEENSERRILEVTALLGRWYYDRKASEMICNLASVHFRRRPRLAGCCSGGKAL